MNEGEKMTEERKQELVNLLEEATTKENLKIRYKHGRGSIYGYEVFLSVDEYRRYLQERWASYSVEPTWFFFNVRPYIVGETTKSKLLGFLREELAPFINEENSVYFNSYAIEGSHADGFRLEVLRGGFRMLDECLNHILKIAIVCGVEEAVSVFERFSCTEGSHGYFQHVASLEGIRLEAEIPVFGGVRLVTVSGSSSGDPPSGLRRHMPSFLSFFERGEEYSARGKTLLIIDRPVFSICHKRSQERLNDSSRIDALPYQFNLDGEEFTDSEAMEPFVKLFCQALSLACNSAVQISGNGWLLAEEKFFHPGNGGVLLSRSRGLYRRPIEVGETEINEAKCLYKILDRNSDIREKLRIPIDRWIQSKVDRDPVDQMIDLGIAFEALYVTSNRKIGKQLRDHASWYLGKDKQHRDKLLTKFRQIYGRRSDAVHSGKLEKRPKFGEKEIPISDFIAKAQNLCRKSIKKILKDKQFPDWNSLILGGEDEQASS